MLLLIKNNIFDTIAVFFALVAAIWLIYTLFLEDIWSAKHLSLDLSVVDAGETVIGGSPHYYLTYKVIAENKSAKQMSLVFARSQLTLHTANLDASLRKEGFRLSPSSNGVHQHAFDHLWSDQSEAKHIAFSFGRYRLDANESVSEVITAAFPKSDNADYISLFTRGIIYPTCSRNWFLAKRCTTISSDIAAVETGDCGSQSNSSELELCNKYFVENSDGNRQEISFDEATQKYQLTSTRHNQVLPFDALLNR